MASATRIGDSTSGICDMKLDCCPHNRTGSNSSGSNNVFFNNIPAHRLGDGGSCNCPHSGNFISTAGSKSVFVNNKPAVRIGDSTECTSCGMPGYHSSGSNNIFIG